MQGMVWAKAAQTYRRATENMRIMNTWQSWLQTRLNDHACKQWVQKQCHACDSSEMQWKTKIVLLQANMHQNDSKCSLKPSRKHLHKEKYKKRLKRSKRHENQTYPENFELNVLKTPRCNVGCQSSKVDVRNGLCIVEWMSFYKIKVMTCMPQI